MLPPSRTPRLRRGRQGHRAQPPPQPTALLDRHRWRFEGEMEDGVIQLRFRKLEQNGKIILHSVMSLGLIDALAGVPAFGPNITNEEAAAMGLNPPAI